MPAEALAPELYRPDKPNFIKISNTLCKLLSMVLSVYRLINKTYHKRPC